MNNVFVSQVLSCDHPTVNLVLPNARTRIHTAQALYEHQTHLYGFLTLRRFKRLGLDAIRKATQPEFRRLWLGPHLLVILITDPEIGYEPIRFEMNLLLEKRRLLNRGTPGNEYKTILVSKTPIQGYPELAGIPIHTISQ